MSTITREQLRIDYTVAHAFAEKHRVPYNAVCAMMHDALSAPPAPAEPAPASGWLHLLGDLVCEAKDDTYGREERHSRINASHAALFDALTKPAPLDMILHCPNCGLQHIDAPDEHTPDWKSEPHRSHLCHGCEHIWRPADVPTNGVAAIKTKGKADSQPPAHPAQAAAPVAYEQAIALLNTLLLQKELGADIAEAYADLDKHLQRALAAAPVYGVALREVEESADQWRALALQFDNHRMQALGYLQRIVAADTVGNLDSVRVFLRAAPLSGEKVLAERIAALSTPSEPVEAVRLTDAEIEDCIDSANTKFAAHRNSGPRGQMLTTHDDWNYWFAREIESASIAKQVRG